jgi:hypothetical protein
LVANLSEHTVSPKCAASGERLHSMSVLLEPTNSNLSQHRYNAGCDHLPDSGSQFDAGGTV